MLVNFLGASWNACSPQLEGMVSCKTDFLGTLIRAIPHVYVVLPCLHNILQAHYIANILRCHLWFHNDFWGIIAEVKTYSWCVTGLPKCFWLIGWKFILLNGPSMIIIYLYWECWSILYFSYCWDSKGSVNRGCYMAARGYEFYLRVLKASLTSEWSKRARDTSQHEMIKFVSPSGHVMFCLFYRYWWNSYRKHNL